MFGAKNDSNSFSLNAIPLSLIENELSQIDGVQIKETCFITQELKSKY